MRQKFDLGSLAGQRVAAESFPQGRLHGDCTSPYLSLQFAWLPVGASVPGGLL